MQQKVSALSIVNFILVGLFLFFEMTVQVAPNVMAHDMLRELPINSGSLGLMSSAYFYSYTLMMIPVGLLFDRFKLQYMLTIALLAVSLGNALFAVVPSVWGLAFARFLMGFGSAFAFVGVLVVAHSWFPKHYYVLLVGITQMMGSVGAMMGETPVALMVGHLGWRNTSWFFSAIALLLAIAIAIVVRPPPKADPSTLELNDSNAASPLHDLLKVLRKPQTYWVALYAFSSWGPITVFAALWGAPYLIHRFAATNVQASWAGTVIWLLLALFSPVLGFLVRFFSHRSLMLGTALVGLCGSLAMFYWHGLSLLAVTALAATIGIGSSGQALSFDLVRNNNPQDRFALSTGMNNVGVVIGGALLQPIFGYLLRWGMSSGGFNFAAAIWLVPACFAMGALLSVLFLRYPTRAELSLATKPSLV